MKPLLLVCTLIFTIGHSVAQSRISLKDLTTKASVAFKAGDYKKTISEIEKLQKIESISNNSRVQGLMFYWMGISNIRINEYDIGILNLEKAIKLKFSAEDIHYEYGQALYVAEQLSKARLAFSESVKAKYKVGVSIYYIAYISQQLGNQKKAVNFYTSIEKLPEIEKASVLQASRMQIADIYLAQVEKLPNSFASIEKYVIPQYEKALKTDQESNLASEIKRKIKEIQRKYDLLVFRMRNGRPTSFPRYFIRSSLAYGFDDNVRNLNESSKGELNEEDFASAYYNATIYSRYTFYPNSSLSVSPELTLSYTDYQTDTQEIKTFNNLSIIGGVQLNYEHLYNGIAATTYLNLDYTYRDDDANSDDVLEKASDSIGVTLSEELQFWRGNPSTFRYRYSQSTAVDETLSFDAHSFIYEQFLASQSFSIFLYSSLDFSRFSQNDDQDTNSYTLRSDFLLSSFYDLFNPNLFISTTQSSFVNDSDRGDVSLIEYGATLSRPVSEKLYLNVFYNIESQSGLSDQDTHSGSTVGASLEYYY